MNDSKFVISIDKYALIELAILLLKFMSFTIDQIYYNQKQGLFIGAPASPCFAEIISKEWKKIIFIQCLWYKKVDDTFAITSHDLGETLQKLSNIDENIEFSTEKASEGNLPFLDCIISLNEKREIITKVYRKPTHTGQYTHFSSNQPLHVKLSTIKSLVRKAKFICSDQKPLNEEISYIRKIMQLNGYPLNVINKTIKDTLQIDNSKDKSKELEPLKMLIPYEKVVAEKLKRVASKYRFTTVFTKTKDLRGQIPTKQEDEMEASAVVYEVDCNNCLKKYTDETGRKWKERIKEHKDDGEKVRKNKKLTGLSRHMKTNGHSPAWDDVRIIYRECNSENRKFKEAARTTSHNKEQLMNKKDERKTICILLNIVLNDKT